MDPSHIHTHVIWNIARVHEEVQEKLRVALKDVPDVFFGTSVSPVLSESEDTTPALPFFMQVFLGAGSLALAAALLVARVLSPVAVPDAEAGR